MQRLPLHRGYPPAGVLTLEACLGPSPCKWHVPDLLKRVMPLNRSKAFSVQF